MSIPEFTDQGILPPFLGTTGPGGPQGDMSPYKTNALEIVNRFGTTSVRQTLLRGWLDHRSALRAAGFLDGFQWLDGSFVEDKQPKDLDVVAFLYRPSSISDSQSLIQYIHTKPEIFFRQNVRSNYQVDFMFVDLNGSPEALVQTSRYCMGLFSHRREDYIWKGMLEVPLNDPGSDQAALAVLSNTSNLQRRTG